MIEYDNISLSYGNKTILKDFSFKVEKGQKVALLGRSGLGKSSLFGLVLGFVEPRSGKVLFDGAVVDRHTVWDVRRRVSFVDQHVSIGDEKVSDWLVFVRGMEANRSLDLFDDKVRELMAFFGLSDEMLNKHISDLSGGERQRVAIVVSVLLGRDVFLLDEVTSALDKALKKKVVAFFTAREDWTVISITHDAVWLDDPNVKVFDLEGSRWK